MDARTLSHVVPLLVAALCLSAAAASANTIRVPGDQPTIQAGIDAASAGDTVLVAPGRFTGPGNRDLSFGGTDRCLLSEAGPEVTIIDCEGTGVVGVRFENGETASSVVEGFTITGCDDGIVYYSASASSISHCTLESCESCGVRVWDGSFASLEHCEFKRPLVCNGDWAEASLYGCVLTDRSRVSAGRGRATLQHCTFVGIDSVETLVHASDGGGDFTLHAESPCAPEHSGDCGLIGAWPVGCGVTAVTLAGVSSPWVGLRVHPNPIRNSGVVEWVGDGGSGIVLRLYDPKGRLVLSREMDGRESGLQRVGWGDLVGGRTLASGIYFLELGRSAGRLQAARVIVVR